ncbi:MAG: hypothetical protein ACHQIG_04730 [Acidimicrobiia bacterium]
MSYAPGPLHDAGLDTAGLGTAAAAVRADWQADEEHWTAAALEQWRHGRTLTDVARDHLHRGDTISLLWAGCSIAVTGRVLGVSDDALAVETSGSRVDVHLAPSTAIAWRVVERAERGGCRGLALGTFRARLLELEAGDDPVDVALDGDDTLHGALQVGRDHIVVHTPGGEWVVALSAVRWVRVPAPT